MKANQIFEDAKQVICIYPGRFQPPHRGHASTYRQLEKKYGAQNTFIATSNKTDADKSPFNFAEKKALLVAAGVPAEQIVQVVNTYAAKEITDRFDLSKTIVVYAVGEKDMGEDPRFSSFVKKDGSPSYLQKMTDNPETADKHAYLIVAPTVQFQINGRNITSASEIRQMYREADPAERADIIHQLYGMNTGTVTQIFNSKLLPQAQPAESIEENFKDGRHPEDKGDAKRHGVPTKASVSTLRKVAKQGGRKGQLAHWMANMKAGKKKAAKEDASPADNSSVVDAVIDFYKQNTQIKPVENYPQAAAEILSKTKPGIREKVKNILVKAKNDPYVQGGVITTIGSVIAGGVLSAGAKHGLTPHQTNIALQAIINTVLPTIISRVNGKDWTETLKYTLASAGIGTAIAAIGEQGKLLDKPTPTVAELAKKYNVSAKVVNVQLAKGIKVEQEHTDHVDVAREIALDHLSERLDYYIRLKKAENESYGATNPTSQLADRAVAVLPFDRFAVKMDENYEPNLFEVSMSPGALNDFAKSEIAQTMTIGFEMELAMPDLPDEGGYSGESESEDDMEYNEDFPTGAGWRRNVISWLAGGDNPNGDRDIDRVMEWFDEQFFDYADEMFNDALDGDEDLQEEVRKEIHDLLALKDKPSDADAIAAEYDEQTDIYTDAVDRVKDEWQTDNLDNAFDDFCMQYRIRDMEDFLNYVNRNHPRLSLHWPYLTYSEGYGEGGDLGDYLQDVANELETKLKRVNSDFYVVVSQDYHDESREENKFIIEPDGSIAPQGREFISPAMQFADGLAAMQVMFEWAQGQGYRTNQSTGFHMGISLPNHETQNIDHMKFILMLGDTHVLEKFNRAKAHYAVDTVNTMRETLKRGDRVKKEDVAGYLRKMATGMQDLATAELNKLLVPRGEHRQSVNIKNKYMEIRSAGDNYLPRFDEIRLTLLRYLKTLEVSADDQAYRREYAKKLSKFLTSTEMIRTVDPVTGRKGVAAKDTLDKEVQMAFTSYFADLQRGASGEEAITHLTTILNQHKGNKISQLKKQLISKRANADVNASKLKYAGSDRVEFSAKGSAYDVINSFIEQMRDAGMSEQHQKAMYMEAPKGQILYGVEFNYRGSTRTFNYWCFAPDKGQAIAQARKAWNTGADQPGDSWIAREMTGNGQRFYYVMRNYLQGNKTPPALPVDRSDISHRRSEQPEERPITYSLRDHQDRGIMTFTTTNDQEANSRVRDFFSQNNNYNLINTTLFRYADDGVTRRPVNLSPAASTGAQQPSTAGSTPETYIITYRDPQGNAHQTAYDANSSREAEALFMRQHPAGYWIEAITTQQQHSVEGTPGTFIVTYLSPQGNEQQTTYNANSAAEAATLFRTNHPASYRLQEITRLQESVTESKKPKQPKTIIDGAMKTLIKKGRSEDEAIADLKKEIDKKFYSEDSVTFDRVQPGETIAEALARARSRLTKS